MTRDRLIELAEWLFWSATAAFLGALVAPTVGIDITQLEAAGLAALASVVQGLILIARWRLSVLRPPGAGLPGVAALQRPKPATHDDLLTLNNLPPEALNELLES